LDYLNDAIISLNRSYDEVLFRVPLSMVIDYRGLRCFITCDPPLVKDETALILGPNKFEGFYKEDEYISKDLYKVADYLGLKEHDYQLTELNQQDPTTINLSVHNMVKQAVFPSFDKQEIDRLSTLKMLGLKPFQKAEEMNSLVYYILKNGHIFPFYAEDQFESATNYHRLSHSSKFHHRLRPEFLRNYPHRLSSDAF